MTKLESYLKQSDVLSTKRCSDNSFKIYAESKDIKLVGKCSERSLDINIVSKQGKSLYPISESYNSSDEVVSKLDEAVNLFNRASIVESSKSEDVDRENPNKEIILDSETEGTVDIVSEDNADIKSISELILALTDIAERSRNIPNIVAPEDAKNKSVIIGLLSSIYALIDDIEEFREDIEESDEDIDESIASKIDYIDLASSGLGQAKYALEKLGKFKNIIRMIEDLKSELVINK